MKRIRLRPMFLNWRPTLAISLMFGMSVVSDLVAALRNADQPVDAGQRAAGDHLGDQRADERLLALDPADVAAVADAVADPHVGERLLAVQRPRALLDGDAVLRAVDVLGHTDLDAVDGVDHVLEAAEVDDDVVVDAHPGGLLELLDRAGRPAVGVGGVPDHVGGAGDVLAVRRSCSRDGRRGSRAGWRRRTPTPGRPRGGTGWWCPTRRRPPCRCRSRRSHGSRSPSPGC